MNVPKNKALKPPSRLSLLFESRALLDIVSVPGSLLASKFSSSTVEGALPIIMFPGFGSDERYMKALGYYLKNLGYYAEGWGLGFNLAGMDLDHTLDDLSPIWELELPDNCDPSNYKGEGGVPFLCEKAIAQVKQQSEKLGSPVVLIGWSLGGYLARECARELRSEVAQVITFGAPIIGGPKYSRAAAAFKAKGQDLDWIERSIEKRNKNIIEQPITSIYSKSDGIVASGAAIDTVSPNVENVHVNAAHLGMGFNRKIWKVIRQSLDKQCRARRDSATTQ